MFTRHISKALLASVAAGLVTFAMTPAQAQLSEQRSVRVSFADLNLKSDAGREHLARRISNAADQVCGSADIRDFNGSEAVKLCRNDAIATANRGLVEVFAQAGNSIRVAAN
jgi:UrcA family protein